MLIPNVTQKLAFGLVRKLPRLKDRKRVNIKLIWTRLRSFNRGALAPPKCQFLSHVWYRWLLLTFMLCCRLLIGQDLIPNETIQIPMRDGFLLPADVYLPDVNAEKLPCILLRSPAGRKAPSWQNFALLAKLGYAVVIQDTRSAVDVEGKTMPFWSDGWGKDQDGYDTVEWLAKSAYTNGKIGTVGFSALGITQLLMAPTAPPALKCQYIGVAASSLYHHGIFPGGQLLKHQVESWLGLYAKDTSVLNHVCNQPFYNYFWSHFNCLPHANRVKVPGFLYGGWYDTFIQGTIDAFVARQQL